MSGQLEYGYSTQSGIPGGIFDLSTKVIDSRVFEAEDDEVAKFGMGMVMGNSPGTSVSFPSEDSTENHFEGILVNGHTQQHDLDGVISIQDNTTVGVMRSGRIWGRTDPEVTISYGDKLYLVTSGTNAGLFTNKEEGNVPVHGRFITPGNTVGMHAIELYTAR